MGVGGGQGTAPQAANVEPSTAATPSARSGRTVPVENRYGNYTVLFEECTICL